MTTMVAITGDKIEITTVKQFRDSATKYLRSKKPVIIFKRSSITGIYIPRQAEMPEQLKRELFLLVSDQIASMLKKKRVKEEDVLEEFEARRRSGHRR
jgi:Cft2 family RNA processing exonuclease